MKAYHISLTVVELLMLGLWTQIALTTIIYCSIGVESSKAGVAGNGGL